MKRICVTLSCLLVCSSAEAQFDTFNMELLDRLPLAQIGGGTGSDIWGWTDSQTDKEYALFARSNGMAFVDVSDPMNATYLGNLPTATESDDWRDVKVYNNHAFIVADGEVGPHGMQIFDLTQLRGVTSPQTFAAPTYNSFRYAHNIAINEESGYAYILGSNRAGGGLHMINIQDPANPFVAGNYSGDGYTHDAQIVNYIGNDTTYQGREIAFAANTDTLTIVDVTNKSNPSLVSRNSYPQNGYTHQGWLSEDHNYYFMNDEFDEINYGGPTRTHIWDVSDLDSPDYLGFHAGSTEAVDHNLYVKGNYIYEANYLAGLRVLEMTDVANGVLTEVAYLDTYPFGDGLGFTGAWSVYPFFDSGTIIVSDIERGLFVARTTFAPPVAEGDFDADGDFDCADVDALVMQIADGSSTDMNFDLTGDGVVNRGDLDMWLALAGAENLDSGNPYLYGDANLDGVVDGTDFLAWNENKFTVHSSWCGGDFTADGVVDGNDFLEWNDHKFTSANAVVVPEPQAATIVLVGLLASLVCRRNT